MGARLNILVHGVRNPKLLCPHCGARGLVHTQDVRIKSGLSGGKVMAGLMTGGLSLLATGLSRKNTMTEAWCANCQSIWHF